MLISNKVLKNSTDEYWSIDGISLHQYGWAVTTFGGARYDVPARRGENVQLAYRPGRIHKPKMADERIISLSFFLIGLRPDGEMPHRNDMRLQWNDSWDFLRRLVWRAESGQVELARRWRLTLPYRPDDLQNYHESQRGLFSPSDPEIGSPERPQHGLSKMLWANAKAELAGTMTPTMTGRTRAEFVMDLRLAYPYFGGEVETIPVDVSTPSDNNVQRIYNPGHDHAGYDTCYIDLIGPLKNPKLTNFSFTPNVWVKYNGTIPSGTTIRAFVHIWAARNLNNNKAVTGSMSHSGARHWMLLQPGNNQLKLTDDNNSAGTATVNFKPPYV